MPSTFFLSGGRLLSPLMLVAQAAAAAETSA